MTEAVTTPRSADQEPQVVLEEGAKVPADARLTEGGVEVDLSMLTEESTPAERIVGPDSSGHRCCRNPTSCSAIATFPVLVWGTDELRLWARRTHHHTKP
ncbi:hypothetical protein ACLF6K_35320 [Streptomyces xanthophaeus]|uniref:P-type ATPase n=1 Tax=Streptomyces xanthophaeus TaxID=67385 RepID=UPI00398F9802